MLETGYDIQSMIKDFYNKTVLYIRNNPRVDWLLLLVGLGVFGLLTFLNVASASIWFDEAFSAYIVRFNYAEILQFTAADVHPPMYYWALKAWTTVFGTTEVAFRSLSILFGGMALSGAFLLARRYFSRSIAAVSLLFLALSPTLIRYSDEARMYTMAAVIVLAATYVLTKATASGKKSWWVTYGILVSFGMWTHYFTAIAWLSHWVWRFVILQRKKNDTKKQRLLRFFSKEWVWAHVLAVGLYLPWIPLFFVQTKHVQSGFWIGQVGVYTPANYMSNFFYYLEQGVTTSWAGLFLVAIAILTIALLPRVSKRLTAAERKSYLLIASIAWAAPAILFVLSMPPLSSVFVERYLVPSLVLMSIFFAVVLVVGTRGWRPVYRALPIAAVAGMMIFGITNVYYYGNYNKNSHTHILTRQAVELVQQSAPAGTPIVANSPWIYYEASFYSTDDYPVYFIDEATEYTYGSLDMLKYRDIGKITNLEEFKENNPVIWYLGGTEEDSVSPHEDSWQMLQTVSTYDHITGKSVYKATEYRVSEE